MSDRLPPPPRPMAASARPSGVPQRGDVLLFHTRVRPFHPSTLFEWLIQRTTRSRWDHAALALGPDPATGKPLMVEANVGGVRVSPIDGLHGELRTVPLDYQGNDLDDVLAFAAARVGWDYSPLNAVMCGVRNVLPGALILKMGNEVTCSELVAEALERAAIDWRKDTARVSPGDVAERFGVPRA